MFINDCNSGKSKRFNLYFFFVKLIDKSIKISYSFIRVKIHVYVINATYFQTKLVPQTLC